MAAEPLYLWLLLLVVPLIVVFWYSWRRSDTALKQLGDTPLIAQLVQVSPRRRRRLRAALMITAWALIAVALARPRWGFGEEAVKRSGLQVLVLLDGSTSMAAQDIRPSRIEAGKDVVSNLLDNLEGNQVGMLMFGSSSYVQFPLTTDLAAARSLVEPINTRSLTLGGTNIDSAINDALHTFPLGEIEGRTLIIITDGGDPDPEKDTKAVEAAREAAKAGLTIHTIGMATTTGAPIPVYDNLGEISYVEQNGQRVTSKLNQPLLEQIASATGGTYFDGQDLDVNRLMRVINQAAPVDLEAQLNRRTQTERFYLFAGLALVLLISDVLVGKRGRMS